MSQATAIETARPLFPARQAVLQRLMTSPWFQTACRGFGSTLRAPSDGSASRRQYLSAAAMSGLIEPKGVIRNRHTIAVELISWSHCGPDGGFSTGLESCGGTNCGRGTPRCDRLDLTD